MEIEKILELGKMGFTKDEILKMLWGEKAGAETATPTPKEKPETKETPEEKEKPEEKEETPESKELKEMRAQLEGLKKMLQTKAIQESEQPKEQSVDDLLGILIKG